MWVAEAHFEGSEDLVRKLLRPGHKYTVGRKAPADLRIAEKIISQDAGSVEIAAWTPTGRSIHRADALPPWPKAYINVGKKQVRIIPRDDEAQWRRDPTAFFGEEIRQGSRREVESGDRLLFAKSAPSIRIYWQPFVLCASPNLFSDEDLKQSQFYLSKCGIAVVSQESLAPGTTHFVTKSASPSSQFLLALVTGAHIVSPDFVDDLAHIEAEALEKELSLPSVEDYFPNDDSLDDATFEELKFNAMPNDSRLTIFNGLTFLFISKSDEVKREFEEMEHVLTMAGAQFDLCPASTVERFADANKVERYLSRKQSEARLLLQSTGVEGHQAAEKGLVLVTDKTESENRWYRSLARASRHLMIPMPEDGVLAVRHAMMLMAPARCLNKLAMEVDEDEDEDEEVPRVSQEDNVDAAVVVIPDQGPPFAEGEEMEGVQARPNSLEVSPVRQDNPTPLPDEVPPELQDNPRPQPDAARFAVPATPSRRPKRRAGRETVDPFADVFGSSTTQTATQTSPSANRPEPSQTSEIGATQLSSRTDSPPRPKRNAAANRDKARRSDVWRSIFDDTEPKSQVDATGPASSTMSSSKNTQERYSKRFRMELEEADRQASQVSVASEVRERQRSSMNDAAITNEPKRPKRRAEADPEDERDDSTTTEHLRPDKSVAQTTTVATPPQPKERFIPEKAASASSSQATDVKFLQSLASLKGRKKQMSALDKEFDQLRIAKPTIEHMDNGGGSVKTMLVDEDLINDPDYRAWQGMSIDDFEVGAAGNFVQVDFVPLVRQRSNDQSDAEGQTRASATSIGTASPMKASWAGRPNFKKFRCKNRSTRTPVELDLPAIKDYGLGLFRGDEMRGSISRSQKQRQSAKSAPKRSIFTQRDEVEDNDTGEDDSAPSSRPATATLRSRQHASSTARDRNARRVNETQTGGHVDLRLDVDDDIRGMDDDDVFDDYEPPRQSTSRTSTQGNSGVSGNEKKRPATQQQPLVVLLDSDDEGDESEGEGYKFTFKKAKRNVDGTKRRSQTATKRR